jgi:hypothetical protein
MLMFEYKFNKEREEENMKVECFACHREGHTIDYCSQLFPHLKNKEDEGRQDRKPRFKKDDYKKKARAMQTMWSAYSIDSDNECSCS